MAGLVPPSTSIDAVGTTWMPGSSPGMTTERDGAVGVGKRPWHDGAFGPHRRAPCPPSGGVRRGETEARRHCELACGNEGPRLCPPDDSRGWRDRLPRHCERSEAIQSPVRHPGLLRCARNDGGKSFDAERPRMAERAYAFFSTDTKNPSVPVRRGVISQPSSDFSAASAKASALSQRTVAVWSWGWMENSGWRATKPRT